MGRLLWIIAIILGCFVLCPPCWASKAYITDSLTMALRAEPNLDQKATHFLSSGQVVEVVDVQDDWSLVQFSNNNQEAIKGWILNRYLITRLPWEIQAKSIKETNVQLGKEIEAVKQELKETSHREDIVQSKLNKLMADLQESQDSYEALKKESQDYISLKTSYKVNKKTIDQLTEENEALRASQMNQWFATGALILLFGLLLGLLIGRQEKKRKAYY